MDAVERSPEYTQHDNLIRNAFKQQDNAKIKMVVATIFFALGALASIIVALAWQRVNFPLGLKIVVLSGAVLITFIAGILTLRYKSIKEEAPPITPKLNEALQSEGGAFADWKVQLFERWGSHCTSLDLTCITISVSLNSFFAWAAQQPHSVIEQSPALASRSSRSPEKAINKSKSSGKKKSKAKKHGEAEIKLQSEADVKIKHEKLIPINKLAKLWSKCFDDQHIDSEHSRTPIRHSTYKKTIEFSVGPKSENIFLTPTQSTNTSNSNSETFQFGMPPSVQQQSPDHTNLVEENPGPTTPQQLNGSKKPGWEELSQGNNVNQLLSALGNDKRKTTQAFFSGVQTAIQETPNMWHHENIVRILKACTKLSELKPPKGEEYCVGRIIQNQKRSELWQFFEFVFKPSIYGDNNFSAFFDSEVGPEVPRKKTGL